LEVKRKGWISWVDFAIIALILLFVQRFESGNFPAAFHLLTLFRYKEKRGNPDKQAMKFLGRSGGARS